MIWKPKSQPNHSRNIQNTKTSSFTGRKVFVYGSVWHFIEIHQGGFHINGKRSAHFKEIQDSDFEDLFNYRSTRAKCRHLKITITVHVTTGSLTSKKVNLQEVNFCGFWIEQCCFFSRHILLLVKEVNCYLKINVISTNVEHCYTQCALSHVLF